MSRGYVFWLIVFLSGCHSNQTIQQVSVIWENERPVALNIPNSFFPTKINLEEIRVYVAENQSNRSIVGSFNRTDSSVIFKTLIPLTFEVTYRITYQHLVVAQKLIYEPVIKDKPELLNIFPTSDTVPENLLKFYFQFSHPMSQTHALNFIFLLNEEGDTLQPFLDLPNELWNNNGTLLTLWLDPGRIKRDLIPNRELGNPLSGNQQYKLVVSDLWHDQRGYALKYPLERSFFVGKRDDLIPKPGKWTINKPAIGSHQYLTVYFHEPLDYGLLKECLSVIGPMGKYISGNWDLGKHETGIHFQPDKPWEGGKYQIQVATILEDLAGNNLNRPFDRNISSSKSINEAPFIFIDFMVN